MPRATSDLNVTASDALEFEAVRSEPPKPRRGPRLVAWGAGISALLGVGWFAAGDMLMRMAAGGNADDIPLIRASAGPVKVRPENPGGLQVPNRDKLVYERIQSGTAATGAAAVERLLPQPEKPLSRPLPGALAPATPPAAAAGAARSPETPPALPTARVPTVKDVASVSPPPVPAATGAGVTVQTAAPRTGAPLSLKRQPARTARPGPAPQPKPAVQAALPNAPATPAARPAPAAPAPATRTSAPGAATARAVPAPAEPSAPTGRGSYRVQLAAARTAESARSEWDRLRRKHLDLLGDLDLTVTKADLGPKKGVFYRLRVGSFANEAPARALCKELSKRKMGCLVVKPGR